MYASGYLTEIERLANGVSRLKIPNLEIWEIYEEKIRGWFHQSIRSRTDMLEKFYEAVKNGRAQEIQSIFNECMRGCISIRDTYARKEMKENFYHGMLLGILQCESSWAVKSNQESGSGYADLLLTLPKDQTGCIIEVKYAENGNFEHGCREALRQIERNHYAEYFEQIGVEKVHAYGIACYKKQCRVWHKQVMGCAPCSVSKAR